MGRHLLGSFVALFGVIGALGIATAEEPASARVTYVTGASIYIDAGSAEGLAPGDRVEVFREGTVVAILEVKDVSTHRASCAIVEGTPGITVGESVRYIPAVAAAEPYAARLRADSSTAAGKRRRKPHALRSAGIRGRVGLRYLVINDRTGQSPDYSQPALDFRLDGSNIAGGPWGLNVDVRTRRTYRNLSDGTSDDDSRTRLYRMAISRKGDEPWNFTLGRQYSPALAAISIFDGLSAEYTSRGWAVGMFSGTQPDVVGYGFSSDIREHGVYFRVQGRPRPGRGWQFSSGLIGSYDKSEVNREFIYVQGRYNGPKLSVYVAEEVDYARDWKKEEGADAVSLTSSFVTLRYGVTKSFNLRAGFDDRRNVRLFRDRVTPITEFDDTFRHGVWGGASVSFRDHYRVSGDVRTNSGGSAGDSDAYTVTFGASNLTSWNFDFHARSSRYTNEQLEGRLYALDVGINLRRRAHFQISSGFRDEENLTTIPPDNQLSWYGFDIDIALGRHWYLLFSAERTDGDLEEVDQLYTTMSYRF